MTRELNRQLGKRIQDLRKLKGFSQETFAEKIHIAPSSLSYIETGRGFMTLSTLEKMSNVLEVEPSELFQSVTITSSEDMYSYIVNKINSIRNNNEKLKTAYLIVRNTL